MHFSVTEIVHDLVRPHLKSGDTAFDGTSGNGHDTLFLAQCVGSTGRVDAWDIQPLAIERTAALLATHAITWVELTLGNHAELDSLFGTTFQAAIFNLGYLPASDRTITTSTANSCRAIRAAAERLATGGILTVLAYTAHSGGHDEANAIGELLQALNPTEFAFHEERFATGRTTPPRLFVLRKRRVT